MEEKSDKVIYQEYESECGMLRCYRDNTFTMYKYYPSLDILFRDEDSVINYVMEEDFDITDVSYYNDMMQNVWVLKIDVG
tara:strand:- start:5390 stop:5629 length:240 start_codon:yes stop_codon:yes gene_type:complete